MEIVFWPRTYLHLQTVAEGSDRDAGRPATEPVLIKDLVATVLHTLFDVGQLRLVQGLPAEIARIINSGKPIEGPVSDRLNPDSENWVKPASRAEPAVKT